MDERVSECENRTRDADWGAGQDEQAQLVSVLTEQQRIRILRLLRDGELCVCEIERSLATAQPLASHHLRILRDTGLVTSRREGQFVFYRRQEERVKQLVSFLNNLLGT
jgi:ArsR family transcriptional regulator